MNENKTAITKMQEWLDARWEDDTRSLESRKAYKLAATECRALESSQSEKDEGLVDLTAIKNDVHQLTRDIAHNTTMDNEDILSRINKIFSRHEKRAK